MSILEDNRTIARFMGFEESLLSKYERDTKNVWLIKDNGAVRYTPDSDWNQLMEVVEKIEKEATVTIEQDYCYIKLYNDLGIVEKEVWKKGNIKREAVYQAVLEYIQQQKED